ncbi:S-methyl-5-thioribose-1-phosphate isomerase [Acidobacteriota bacterium]
MSSFHTVEWKDGVVIMLDQRKLPLTEEYLELRDHHDVAEAIKNLSVRGAPAIGVSAALGIALGVHGFAGDDSKAFERLFDEVCDIMSKTRPTAVNLFWAIKQMRYVAESRQGDPPQEIKEALLKKALSIRREDEEINRNMGWFGQDVIPDDATVLTHCNAGALACADYGTALGVIRAAVEKGKKVKVFADETRPILQGARLTAWELQKDGIPVTLITDNMAGYVMKQGMIDVVVVGADRVAANGDVANKIGTYSVAVLARENNVPFYVAAPLSTYDAEVPDGLHIPIEQRDPSEVTVINGVQTAPEGIDVFNPAFDITPNELIAGIITEKGIVRTPYREGYKKFMK